MTNKQIIDQKQYQKLQNDISLFLNEARIQMEKASNAILANAYWQIGKRIAKEEMTENSNYKFLILQDLERDLNISKKTLSHALRVFEAYPSGMKHDLSWSHYRNLITIADESLRNDLTARANDQNWSVRELESNIKELNNGKSSKSSKKTQKIKRPSDPSYLYKAKIVNVVDGDTLILNIDLGFQVIKEQRVRLAQIDAPEMNGEEGRKSHRYLRDLCAGIEEVAIKTNKVDIYGRYLGDIFYLQSGKKANQNEIFTEGVYLNAKLVEEGLAKAV